MTKAHTELAIKVAAAIGLASTLVPIGNRQANAAELVAFETAWCASCQRFRREAAPLYPSLPGASTAPLRTLDMQRQVPGFRLATPVEGTPTFVLVDQGREIGRIVGYASWPRFRAQAMALLARTGSRKRR